MNLIRLLTAYILLLLVSSSCSLIPTLPRATPQPTVQIVEITRLGRGVINEVVISPDSTMLAVASSLGVWLYDLETWQQPKLFEGHTGVVSSIVWSLDSTRLASASEDGTVRLWDAANGQQLHAFEGQTYYGSKVIWSPNGDKLAVNGENGTVRIWDTITGKNLSLLEDQSGVIAWSPDGTKLASVGYDHTIQVLNTTNGQQIHALGYEEKIINHLLWSPDGTQLVLVTETKIILLDSMSGQRLQVLESNKAITGAAWSPDSFKLAWSGLDETVQVWDMARSQRLDILEELPEPVYSIAWSPDGNGLVLGGWDGTVRVWLPRVTPDEHDTSPKIRRLPGRHHNWMTRVNWSPDGTKIISWSNDNAFFIWDATTGRQLGESEGYTFPVESLTWSPDGTQLAVGSAGSGLVQVWSLISNPDKNGDIILELVYTLNGKALDIEVTWSPDGTKLATGGRTGSTWNGKVQIWDAITGRQLREFGIDDTNSIESLAWSPDASLLAIGSKAKDIQIWDVTTGKRVHLLGDLIGGSGVQGMTWSPDGTMLAVNNGIVHVWDVTGEQVHTVLGIYDKWVGNVSWSPNGTMLASAGTTNDNKDMVWIWDVTSKQLLHELPGGNQDVAWSPDGRLLASSGKDIYIWDVASGRLLRTAKGHTDNITSIAWSPDGTMLASSSLDGTIRIWHVQK